MRKLGPLNAMSIKAGDAVSIDGLFQTVKKVESTSFGNIRIVTENYSYVFNPVDKVMFCA